MQIILWILSIWLWSVVWTLSIDFMAQTNKKIGLRFTVLNGKCYGYNDECISSWFSLDNIRTKSRASIYRIIKYNRIETI